MGRLVFWGTVERPEIGAGLLTQEYSGALLIEALSEFFLIVRAESASGDKGIGPHEKSWHLL